MNKLLAANFMRVKKSKAFWGCIIFMVVLGGAFPINQYITSQKYGYETMLETSLLVYAIFIGTVLSAFCGLFLGTEYGDGTIRNKVVIGHKRSKIYLANLITCSVAGMVMCASFVAVYLAFGIPMLGGFTLEIKTVLMLVCASLCMTAAFSAVFTMIGMLNQNKAVIAVICILFAFISLFAGQYIAGRLDAPEMYDGYEYIGDDGEMVKVEAEKNPKYLQGTERKVYEFIHDVLPGDQQVQINQWAADKPWQLMLYSAGVTVVITAVGMMFFKKKDLK